MSVESGISIAEAARESGISTYTLRYYERAGLIDGVDRDSGSGHRRYSEADLAWIYVLQCLRATGMPIRDIRRYAELARDGAATYEQRLALLEQHRAAVQAQLEQTQTHLAFIDRKITNYKERLRG